MSHAFSIWTLPVLMQDRFTTTVFPKSGLSVCCVEPPVLWASCGRLFVYTKVHPWGRDAAEQPHRNRYGLLRYHRAWETNHRRTAASLFRNMGSVTPGGWQPLTLEAGPDVKTVECTCCEAGRGCECWAHLGRFDPDCGDCAGEGLPCEHCDGDGFNRFCYSQQFFSLTAGLHPASKRKLRTLVDTLGPAEWKLHPWPESNDKVKLMPPVLLLRWPQAMAVLQCMRAPHPAPLS